ncbi:uncharacterized protein TNCV_647431 [Trichonephila clavipes]|uniref:Uncharacterized protein n=1 Tax=Trichonephila clavipes TaxID=2585209 RepID=A0A8X6SJ58_TRICX|nr:uncharacterized protein TNCV_647431 [Trichonephila clavipes]
MLQADHELQHLQKIVFCLFRLEGKEPLPCATTFVASRRRSLYNAYFCAGCVYLSQRTKEMGPLIVGNRTRFLKLTAIGFCTFHRRVQIHTGERFRASADLEGTTHRIPSIQHC